MKDSASFERAVYQAIFAAETTGRTHYVSPDGGSWRVGESVPDGKHLVARPDGTLFLPGGLRAGEFPLD